MICCLLSWKATSKWWKAEWRFEFIRKIVHVVKSIAYVTLPMTQAIVQDLERGAFDQVSCKENEGGALVEISVQFDVRFGDNKMLPKFSSSFLNLNGSN